MVLWCQSTGGLGGCALRFIGLGGFGLLVFALWIFCIFDVIAAEEVVVRNLPKMVWLLIVIFVPTVGAVAWLALGRPLYAGWRPGSTERRQARRPLSPEDAPTWAPPRGRSQAELAAWEEDLAKRERELRRKKDGGPEGPDGTINPNW